MYNFNGKFYNKPGHLGMTTAQVKAALAGGGSPFYLINLSYEGDNNPVLDKTFAEISAAVADGLIPYVIYKGEGSSYIFFDINEIYDDYAIFKSTDFAAHDQTSFYMTISELTLLDSNECTEIDTEYRVSAIE